MSLAKMRPVARPRVEAHHVAHDRQCRTTDPTRRTQTGTVSGHILFRAWRGRPRRRIGPELAPRNRDGLASLASRDDRLRHGKLAGRGGVEHVVRLRSTGPEGVAEGDGCLGFFLDGRYDPCGFE